jgi:hypothetical protein
MNLFSMINGLENLGLLDIKYHSPFPNNKGIVFINNKNEEIIVSILHNLYGNKSIGFVIYSNSKKEDFQHKFFFKEDIEEVHFYFSFYTENGTYQTYYYEKVFPTKEFKEYCIYTKDNIYKRDDTNLDIILTILSYLS